MLEVKRADTTESCGAQPPGTRRILNLEQAAEYLGISRSHLLNIVKGKVKGVPPLQPIRAGRRLLFRRLETLDQWLREAERKPTITNSEEVLSKHGEERC
jgi:predicted DNA-binding transcriptional regulator AlpA